ncbi:MAG: hypothetical protein L6R30_09600 [Thermoanaerobaculia bacterium]|nr:hypothetical protein [Thermoanaerobaculia bacterium]
MDMVFERCHALALTALLAACGTDDRASSEAARADGGVGGSDASSLDSTHVSYLASATFSRYGDRLSLRAEAQIELRKEPFGESFTCSISNEAISIGYRRNFMVPACENLVGTSFSLVITRTRYSGPGVYTVQNTSSSQGDGLYMALSPYLHLTTADPQCPPNHCLGIRAEPGREGVWISCALEILEHTADYLRGSFVCDGGTPNVADTACPNLKYGSIDAEGSFFFLTKDCPPP